MKKCFVFLICICTANVNASVFSDAHKLGAFTGAMKYCEDEYGRDEGRYKISRMKAWSVVQDMSGPDKMKAILGRDSAYRDGRYLGNHLNSRECKSLLRAGEWKNLTN